MILLGLLKFLIFMTVVIGSVIITSNAKRWYRRIILVAPLTFIIIMLIETLFRGLA